MTEEKVDFLYLSDGAYITWMPEMSMFVLTTGTYFGCREARPEHVVFLGVEEVRNMLTFMRGKIEEKLGKD